MNYELKKRLDELVVKYNVPEFADSDPVQFPRRYSQKNDIEIVSFLIATIAWGKRSMILNSANKLLNTMGNSPYDFVMSDGWKRLDSDKCVHRTFFNRDFIYYCNGLKHIYNEYQNISDYKIGFHFSFYVGEEKIEKNKETTFNIIKKICNKVNKFRNNT